MSKEPSPNCPQCGAPLPDNAPAGLCPNCLMALNLKTETVFTDAPATAQPPLPPEQIAPHFPQLEILECLGRGGMGVVYKARQKTLNRLVALKLLAPERVNDPRFAERFTREAQALAALNHPNIVTIHDFGQAGGFYFLLMEFVDGANLRQLMRARKFAPEEALAIVPVICDALQFAHNHGIVHRDIKPENILLNKEGKVKIADFGIAKMLGNGDTASPSNSPENATHSALGTPGYHAPEQKTDPQHTDNRADIYSLGVVFYEMLTGELPAKRIEPPSKKVHIDVRLDAVVLRALEKTPELRWQTAEELRTEIETIAATTPGSSGHVSAPQKPDHFWRRFTVVVLALISIPFLIALLGLFAAIAIPAFVKGRQHALALREQQTTAKSDDIGESWFPQGDSIEITSVQRTKDEMVVKGHYTLASVDHADLSLNITTTNRGWTQMDPRQTLKISQGSGDFELFHPNLAENPGWPHVSMYAHGHSFAGIYFGTQKEADEERSRDIGGFRLRTELPSSPAVSQANEPDDLREARAKLAELRVTHGEQNPDLQAQLARIKELEQMSKEEPDLPPDLREAKAHLAEMRFYYGEHSPEIQAQLARIRELDRMSKEEPTASPELREAKANLAELRFYHGEHSPEIQEALAKIQVLESAPGESSGDKEIVITNVPIKREDIGSQSSAVVSASTQNDDATSTGPVELKLKWPSGKRYLLDFDFKQDTAILLRGRTDTVNEDVTIGNQLGLTVLQETPGGGHELELEFISARMGIKMGNHTILDYDSANESAVDPTNGVAAVFGKIVGSNIRYFLNSANDPVESFGIDGLVQRIQSVPQTDPLTTDLKNIFNAAYFEAFTNISPFLPHQAVQPGDTWPSHLEHPVTGVGIEVWDFNVVFQNWETHDGHKCARLDLQGIMKVKPDPNAKRDETTYHPRDGVAEGVAWFDPELGQAIETDLKQDLNVDKKSSPNPDGTPNTAEPGQTITTQRHQVYTIKLKM